MGMERKIGTYFPPSKEEADGDGHHQPGRRRRIGCFARARPSARLALLSTEEKKALLLAMADAIEANAPTILAANREDVERSGLEGAMRDRLLLNPARIKEMAQGVREVAALGDPIGETLAEWTRPNGLHIRKVRVPLGVVGIIYESRPNVTVDTAVLALKTATRLCCAAAKKRRAAISGWWKFLRLFRECGGSNRTSRFEHAAVGAGTDQGARGWWM